MDELQAKVKDWIVYVFGEPILYDRKERAMRVLEEAMELAQAEGVTFVDMERLALRCMSRPAGRPNEEAAQVMVTLLGWAAGAHFRLGDSLQNELLRIHDPAVMETIRAKQQQKAAAGVGRMP